MVKGEGARGQLVRWEGSILRWSGEITFDVPWYCGEIRAGVCASTYDKEYVPGQPVQVDRFASAHPLRPL